MNLSSIISLFLVFTGSAVFSANEWQQRNVTMVLPDGVVAFNGSDGYSNSIFEDSTGTNYGRTGVILSGSGCRVSPGFYSNAFVKWKPLADSAYAVGIQKWGGDPSGTVACITPDWIVDTTPLQRHFYDGFTYCKANHSIYLVLGAFHRIKPDTNSGAAHVNFMLDDTGSTWRYSITENKWHRIRSSLRRIWPSEYTVSNYEAHLRYWPEGRKLLFVDASGGRLAEFNIETEQWTNISEAGRESPFSLYNSRSCWDSKRSLWVFRQDVNICAYDPAKKSFHRLPSCGISGTAEKGAPISYDSQNDCYLVTGSDTKKTRYFTYEDSMWHAPAIADSVALPFPGYLTYDSVKKIHMLTYQHTFWTFSLEIGSGVSTENHSSIVNHLSIKASRNPFRGSVIISGGTVDTKISIFDLSGKKVASGFGKSMVWDASVNSAGVYIVKMTNQAQKASILRLIKY